MAIDHSFAVTVLLLFLSLAYARFQSGLPDAVTLTGMPETTKSVILPSEKPETKPATVVELQPESESGNDVKFTVNDIEPDELKESPRVTEAEKKTDEPEKTGSEPLTVISFRPINRHFPRHRLLPFRHGHKTRHTFRPGGPMRKQWGPGFNGGGFTYGNDMTLSGGRHDREFLDPVSRGVGVREIPKKWAKDLSGRPRFPIMRGGMERREDDEIRNPHMHRPIHRLVGIEKEYDHDRKQRLEHRYGEGFMKRIRKFLNHHF